MAAKRKGAGSLSERVVFMEPSEAVVDGAVTQGYIDKFTDAARLQPRMGSEPIIASRLAGTQPYTLTVRSSVATRAVTPAWRARHARTGKTYDIKSVANVDERNAYIEMMVVEGQAG